MWGQVMQCESIMNPRNRAGRDISLFCSPQHWELISLSGIGVGSTKQILLFPCSVGSAAHCGGHSCPQASSPFSRSCRRREAQSSGPAGTDTDTNTQLQAQSTFSSMLVWETGKHPIPLMAAKPAPVWTHLLLTEAAGIIVTPQWGGGNSSWTGQVTMPTSSYWAEPWGRTQACSTAWADHINSTLLWRWGRNPKSREVFRDLAASPFQDPLSSRWKHQLLPAEPPKVLTLVHFLWSFSAFLTSTGLLWRLSAHKGAGSRCAEPGSASLRSCRSKEP